MWWMCIVSSGKGRHIPDFLPHLILVRVDDKRHLTRDLRDRMKQQPEFLVVELNMRRYSYIPTFNLVFKHDGSIQHWRLHNLLSLL